MTPDTLTLEELTPVEALTGEEILFRQTWYNNMDLCAFRLYEGEGTLPTFGEKLAFGSVTHKACALIVEGADPLAVIGNLDNIAQNVLDEEYEVPNWRELVNVDQWADFLAELAEAVSVYAKFLRPIIKGGEPEVVEKELYARIGSYKGKDIVLRGTPDLYINSILYDYKTAGRPWDESKPGFAVQAPLYFALLYSNNYTYPESARYLVYPRNKGEIYEMKTEPSIPEINGVLVRSTVRAAMIYDGLLPQSPYKEQYFKYKRGWYCSPNYCENWNICPAKALGDGVDENQIAVTSW